MPKLIMVIMQQNYPFGQCEQVPNDNNKVVVRKIYPLDLQVRSKLLQKVSLLRNLKSQHMIKIDTVLEQEESIHLLYEYVPIKLETWISNINDQFIQSFRDQLIKFSSLLANNSIKTEFQLKNIGMDENYRAKYFLDFSFEVDNTIHREKLKSNYIREITNLFKPYILSAQVPSNKKIQSDIAREPQQKVLQLTSSIVSVRTQDFAISPPTNKASSKETSTNKQQAIAQYIQQANISIDSENQKLVQEFMDVLNNDYDEVKVQNRSSVVSTTPQQVSAKPAASVGIYSKRENQHDSMDASMKNSHQIIQRNNKSQTIQNEQNKPQFNQPALQRFPQGGFNTSPNNNLGESPRNIPSYQSMGRGKSEMKEPTRREQRDSDYLQIRVKSAIEKSLLAIKKFKSIRSNPVF